MSDAILAAGSILLGKVSAICEPVARNGEEIRKVLKNLRYLSLTMRGSRQILPESAITLQILPGGRQVLPSGEA